MSTIQNKEHWQRLLPHSLRNFHTWLMALPWQIFILAGAGVALNVASDLGNTFGAASRFGGPWVAVGTLLAFLAFFALALLASHDARTGPIRVGHSSHEADRAGQIREGLKPSRTKNKALQAAGFPYLFGLAEGFLRYLLLTVVVWTALQAILVIAHMPHTLASPHNYGSDEMYYAHYNAWLVLHGQNPYVGDHLAGALHYFHVENVTLLRTAPYADPLHPPTTAQTDALVAAYLAHPQAPHPQLEPATTHSYPALSFLIALPSVWMALPTLGYAQVVGLLALLVAICLLAPPPWRVAVVALCLLDVDGIRSVAGSDFAIWTVAGVGLVWMLGSRKVRGRDTEGTEIHAKYQREISAAIALGLVCAVQQTAWFFAPFYVVWVWRMRGLQAAVQITSVAVGAFLVINVPWIVLSPGSWLHSLLLPMTLPLFPTGGGLVGLGLGGALPLWSPTVYTALELVAFAGLLAGYAYWFRYFPYAGLLLPMLPLLLAWRSPSRYFILLPFLGILAVVLAWRDARSIPTSERRPAVE